MRRLGLGRWGGLGRRGLSGGVEGREGRVVIGGGGVTGLSAALRLRELSEGARPVLVLEAGALGAVEQSSVQTSAHPLHLHRQLWPLAERNDALLRRLVRDHPSLRYQRRPSLLLASTSLSQLSLSRMAATADVLGVTATLLSPDDVRRDFPFVSTDGLKGALLLPDDRVLDLASARLVLAKEATKAGVEIIEGESVSALEMGSDGWIAGVTASSGHSWDAAGFVDCSGLDLGSFVVQGPKGPTKAHTLPAQACTYSVLTALLPRSEVEFVMDLDARVWISGGDGPGEVRIGGWPEQAVRAVTFTPDQPESFQSPDWDLFYPILEAARSRFPGLSEAEAGELRTGQEMYTADGAPLVGAHPKLDGCWLGGGLCGMGGSLGLGLGELLGRWVWKGGERLQQDVSAIEATRFLDLHSKAAFINRRAPEVASYSLRWLPMSHGWKKARGIRKSPIYPYLEAAGAHFGEVMGYERPLFFKSSPEEVVPPWDLTGRPPWFHYVAKEYEAARERVALIDMSNFTKLDVWSEEPEAVVGALQWLCSSDVDRPVGTTVYTGLQNHHGGYQTDCTLSRLGPAHFFMVAPTVQQVRCSNWLRQGIRQWRERNPGRAAVHVHDSTSLYTALNVLGPQSRALLSELSGAWVGPEDFPAFAARELEVGAASGIRAISVTHCGELGWVLYVPNEFSQALYQDVVRVGQEFGLAHAGYLALRHLRIEKFYVYWGMDIDSTTTPIDCGRHFRVSMDKDFLGREALARELREGSRRRNVQLLVQGHQLDSQPWPQGDEPVLRDGLPIGFTTTAAYGFTLRHHVALATLWAPDDLPLLDQSFQDWLTKPARYTIRIGDKELPVVLHLRSPALPMVSSEHPAHYRPTQ